MRGTPGDFARQLTVDNWAWEGTPARYWDITAGDTLGVDLGGLDAGGQQLARWALNAWTAATGLRFAETGRGAQITFVDDAPGGLTTTSYRTDGELVTATVNVGARDTAAAPEIGGRAYTLYLHEIGHALGLGHPGNYRAKLSRDDAVFDNDTYLMSALSYFDPSYDSRAKTGYARPITPMPGDIAAIRALYGEGPANPGDTVYGAGGDADGPLGLVLAIESGDLVNGGRLDDVDTVFTIVDSGGTDTIDASSFGAAQVIDLRPGAYSTAVDVPGGMAIAAGSVIENAIGTGHADRLGGNSARNVLSGQGGDDWMHGRGGADRLVGGGGNDALRGGGGRDKLVGQAGDDLMLGGGGRDVIRGNSGDDRLKGGGGPDRLYGGGGDDEIYGRSGADRLHGRGHRDELHGNAGADRLYGDVGHDKLYGGAGDDLLNGGAGDDLLVGGFGADVFVFVGAFGDDVIADPSGGDRIDLAGVAAITGFDDLRANHLRQLGDDLVIDDGAGNTITARDVPLGEIGADDFIF